MMQMSLETVNAVYDCARLAKIEVHNVDDAAFHRFCLLVKKFERSLGESAKDDYWTQFLRALRRYRFDVSSTPLPFKYPVEDAPNFVEQLQERLSHCDLIFPQFADPARELIDSLLSVLDTPSNPLLAVFADIAEGKMDMAMLIKEPRHIPAVERLLRDRPGFGAVEVISPPQLKGHSCYSELMVIGPSRWYGEYVFQSPRANFIHVVKYKWMNDSKSSSRVFSGSASYSGVGWTDRSLAESAKTQKGVDSPENSLDAEDFLPSIDWGTVLQLVSARNVGDSDDVGEEEEYVSARLFQLEGEIVVPLDAAESARATVLVLSHEEDDPVQRIPVSSIEAGMFLLVRTGGGGEYIVHVADGVLGAHATRARQVQRDWKDRLRRKVRQNDLHHVVQQLKDYGSKRANDVNVRNWMSYRSIKTEDPKDFRAVMKLIGLEERFEEHWNTMELIDSAHRRAGHLIRQQLFAEVRNSDLQDLDKLGKMDFELPGVEGGQLTAIRIQSGHPQIFEIEVARLGHPVEMERNVWQG